MTKIFIAAISQFLGRSIERACETNKFNCVFLVNEENMNLEFYLKAFMTTSPSYLIMASLDYARYYLDNYGENGYEKLIDSEGS